VFPLRDVKMTNKPIKTFAELELERAKTENDCDAGDDCNEQ